MKRMIVALVAALALFAGSAGTADAGEYNGNDDRVPGGVNGASLCSFSGLDIADDLENDGEPDDELFPRQVQSYGQLVSIGLKGVVPSPGQLCRGNLGGG